MQCHWSVHCEDHGDLYLLCAMSLVGALRGSWGAVFPICNVIGRCIVRIVGICICSVQCHWSVHCEDRGDLYPLYAMPALVVNPLLFHTPPCSILLQHTPAAHSCSIHTPGSIPLLYTCSTCCQGPSGSARNCCGSLLRAHVYCIAIMMPTQ